MKKTILTTIITAGISCGVFAQGVFVDLTGNSSTSPTATSGGVLFDGPGSTLATDASVNLELLAGTSSGSLSSLIALTGGNAPVNVGPGLYLDVSGTPYNVPGLAANTAGFFQALWWTGSSPSYAGATGVGDLRGDSGIFSNPTGGGGAPPTVPPGLTGMPAVHLLAVPEPTTIALTGLGLASLLLFRRRK